MGRDGQVRICGRCRLRHRQRARGSRGQDRDIGSQARADRGPTVPSSLIMNQGDLRLGEERAQ